MVCLLLMVGCGSATKHVNAEPNRDSAATQAEQQLPPATGEKKTPPGRKIEKTAPATAAAEAPDVFQPKMPGARIARVQVPGPYVALTFDDGPSAAYTPHVLDILRRRGAKATFFVLGENAVRHKEILARAVAEGHEIGSHTWSHVKMTSAGAQRLQSELDRTAEVIRAATGRAPAVMRPPYGATNAKLIDWVMQRYGTPSILWDVDTQDWKHPGVGVVVSRVLHKSRRGSIILLHDIHASTLAAVDDIVAGLQARGFKLVTVSELIAMGRRAAAEAEAAPAPGQAAPPAAPQQPAKPTRGIWLRPIPGDAGQTANAS